MPAPDRLADLRRQRERIQEHLAWLDREIASAEREAQTSRARTTGRAAAQVSSVAEERAGAAQAMPSASPHPLPAEPDADHQAEAILSEYRAASSDLQRDVRKGCLLYFVGALGVLSAAVALLWFALRR